MNKALIILLILANIHASAQSGNDIDLEYEFQLLETSNKAEPLILSRNAINDTSLVEYNSLITSAPGEIIGPFKADSVTFYTKTLEIDSAYICHVGNIWISTNKGWDYAESTANRILKKVKAGENYDTFCKSFSDDKNKKTDCELPWTFTTSFVEPFAKAIENHEEGEIFVVKTKFGYHVVKIIDQGRMERKTVTYLKILI